MGRVRPSYAGNKRDANEAEIVEYLRAAGFGVILQHDPVDLLVWRGARSWLVEIKAEGRQLNAKQQRLRDRGVPFHVLRSVEDAQEWAAERRGTA